MSAPSRPTAGPLSAPVVLLKISTAPVTGDDLACAPRENVRKRVNALSTAVLRACSRCVILPALALAMADMVSGSDVLMSRLGNGRDLDDCDGCSCGTFITPLPFVCVAACIASAALPTVCESEAANKTAIAITKTSSISFLVERGKSEDIKSSLDMVVVRQLD